MTRSVRRLSLQPPRRTAPVAHPLIDLEARYLQWHQAANHSKKTIERYEETFFDLHRFIEATRRPDDTSLLTSEHLNAFGAWLRETPIKPWRGKTERSIHTVHGRLKDLRAFTKWLVDEEVLDKQPKIILPKLPEELFPILTDDQLHQLFHCPHLTGRGPQAIRNRALLAFLLDTGARLSEVANIQLKDLDLDEGMAKVLGKGNRERLVFFHKGAEKELRAWLTERGEWEGELFGLTPRGIQMLFHRIRQETGLPVHVHLMRHQAATIMVRNTGDIHYARRVLGHRQLSTVEKYLSLSQQDLKAKHSAASPFDSIQLTEPPPKQKRRRLSL